ncbi:RNA ligase family protein [Nannocystaceae bacterium ST9]
MRHRAYPKITLELAPLALGDSRWIATEKIHGAQFVLATDGDAVAFGKRKAWLAADEPFFGWQALRRELDQAARDLHAALAHVGPLYLYGELFGGSYPDGTTTPLPGIQAVQTGIWYSPALRYAAFDLLLANDDDDEQPRFVAHHQLEALAEACGLGRVPVLGRGSRSELARLPVRFETRVPASLGLAPLAGNVAEGLVLKPDLEIDAARRPIVKKKIPEFAELQFDESRPFDADAHLNLSELLQWAETMINAARIASARSKVGEDPVEVRDEALLDVWIDLESMFPRRMRGLDEDEQVELRDALVDQLAAWL